MMLGLIADDVGLSDQERQFLKAQVWRHKAGLASNTVGKWQRRFVKERIEGITGECRLGRPRIFSDEQVGQVIDRTQHSTPKDAIHCRSAQKSVNGPIAHHHPSDLAAFGLRSYRFGTFKVSTDQLFVDKVQDIVGSYLSLPYRTAILCKQEIPDTCFRARAITLADGSGYRQSGASNLRSQRHNPAICSAGYHHSGSHRNAQCKSKTRTTAWTLTTKS